jgi:hypothetical protein
MDSAKSRVPRQAEKPKAGECPACSATLNNIDYKMWGSKSFDQDAGSYLEDETLGTSDMEFTCPSCSAKLDPEGIIF